MKHSLAILLLLIGSVGHNSLCMANNEDRLILVSGATGTQGGAVTQALLEKGFPVRALTRNPDSERARELLAMGVEIVQGDFDDAASLDRALSGVYGAFSVQQWRHVGIDGEIRHGKSFADAAKRADIKHFVYTSNAAAAEKSGIPNFDSKYVIEEHIRLIDLPHTIIGPRGFMTDIWGDFEESITNGVIEGVMDPSSPVQYIAPRDIGRFVALALEDPDTWISKSLGIAGDELTMPELAELLTHLSGKPVVYRQLPWEEFAKQSSPEALRVPSWYRNTTFRVDVQKLREDFPWMMTVEEYLQDSDWLGR